MKTDPVPPPAKRHLSPGVETPEQQIGFEYDRAMYQFRSQFYGTKSRQEIEELVDVFEPELFLKHPEYPGNKYVKMTQECREAVRPKPSKVEVEK